MTPSNIQFYKINTWEDYLTRNPEQLNTVLPQLMLFCANREFDHFFYHTMWYEKLSVALSGRNTLRDGEKYSYQSLLKDALLDLAEKFATENKNYQELFALHPLFSATAKDNESREKSEKILLEALKQENLLPESQSLKHYLKAVYHAKDPLYLFLAAGCDDKSFYAEIIETTLSHLLAHPKNIDFPDEEALIDKILARFDLENKLLNKEELLRDIAPSHESAPEIPVISASEKTAETAAVSAETIAINKPAEEKKAEIDEWQTRVMPQVKATESAQTQPPQAAPDLSPEEANEEGIRLFKGDGVAQDHEAAVQMFAQAARGGSPEGQYNLAFCYLGGYGIAQDNANALKWYDQAAQKSYLPAMCRLAEIYEKGQGAIKPNAKLALHWYERAALNGHTESQFKTAQYYAQGEGCTKNYEQAAKYYLLAAENNHAQAQYNYGVCCYMALGRKKDIDESFRWYQKAADNGLAIAQNELGNCYFYSSGTEKNDAEAVKWYQKAAASDYPPAECNLAVRYYLGQGVKENNAEAFKWFQKAASHGYAEAENYLGLCYDNGYGTKKDQKSAFSYYSLAAEKKYPEAVNNLALCYYYGTGTKKDKNKAKELFIEASSLGSQDAKDNLKKFYKIHQ